MRPCLQSLLTTEVMHNVWVIALQNLNTCSPSFFVSQHLPYGWLPVCASYSVSTGARWEGNVLKAFKLGELLSGVAPQSPERVWPRALPVEVCVLHRSLLLSHSFKHMLSLHLVYTFFHPLYFSFSASLCLASVLPPRHISGLHSGISQSQWTPGVGGREGRERL